MFLGIRFVDCGRNLGKPCGRWKHYNGYDDMGDPFGMRCGVHEGDIDFDVETDVMEKCELCDKRTLRVAL